ncbi:hypothetical protein ACFLXJ_02965 [Chloroflexota bacterium]
MLNFLVDSPNLSLGFTGTDNEIISEAAYLSGVQEGNITRLPVADGFYCFTGYFDCFQTSNLPTESVN